MANKTRDKAEAPSNFPEPARDEVMHEPVSAHEGDPASADQPTKGGTVARTVKLDNGLTRVDYI